MTAALPLHERVTLPGSAGDIEARIETPQGVSLRDAFGVVCHPHPLFGGTLDNKVAQTLAKAFAELRYLTIRPNFRGIGGTEGAHDHGEGETDDLVRVIEWAHARFGPLPVVLAGFSFGAYVQTRVAQRVKPERMALVGVPDGLVTGGRTYKTGLVPPDTIVIHGEQDETAPLANVLDWARPQELPIVVVPGADHFFHRKLHLIKNIIKGAWN